MFNINSDMSKTKTEETIIAHGVRMEGDFVSQGEVLIEGEVNGNVQTAGDLRVGNAAKIKADVVAKNAIVGGEIRGNMQVSGRLEVLETAKIIGDVTASVLSIIAGASLNGKVTMDGREVATPKEDKKS
jgi:cytoskeletal protein CcmA (bactofilin family)